MSPDYRLSLAGRITWITAVLAIPLAAVFAIFWVTDDTLVPHQNSQLAKHFTETGQLVADPQPVTTLPNSFGKSDGSRALVLYDDHAEQAEAIEMYAIVTANLATHFGSVTISTLDAYESGDLKKYDGAFYVGTDHTTTVPNELICDVRSSTSPVLWIGQNTDALSGQDAEVELDADCDEPLKPFAQQYGWDPTEPIEVASDTVPTLKYKDTEVNRFTEATDIVNTPRILDEDLVDVLASGGKDNIPWVIRSGNLTFLTELPYHFIDKNDLYLLFSDLYYDVLGPDIEPVQQAAVRLEDVSAESSPEDLRNVADLLSSKGIPFQVAVIPVLLDRTPDAEDWYGMSLQDSPDVVEALKYMQERGGTLIQHGTTHQYGEYNNPYSGRSGEDYEFYGYGCSATEFPPYEWEECEQDSWVRKAGPLEDDSVEDHATRLQYGKQIMAEAGLGEPTIFETPHYTASVNANKAMAQNYDARYEQVEYFAGMISSGQIDSDHSYGQIFPYTVHDIYGSTVYPENLQNMTEESQNNHPARSTDDIVARAEANLIVRESTASFYFHPFLDLTYLEEMVDGIQDLGYTFVPVDELR